MVALGQYVRIFSMARVLAAVYIVLRLKALSEHSTSQFLLAMLSRETRETKNPNNFRSGRNLQKWRLITWNSTWISKILRDEITIRNQIHRLFLFLLKKLWSGISSSISIPVPILSHARSFCSAGAYDFGSDWGRPIAHSTHFLRWAKMSTIQLIEIPKFTVWHSLHCQSPNVSSAEVSFLGDRHFSQLTFFARSQLMVRVVRPLLKCPQLTHSQSPFLLDTDL